MVCKCLVKVMNKWIRYEPELERCATVIRGDSGVGKSSLIHHMLLQWRNKLYSFYESPDFDAWVHEDLYYGGRQSTIIND